MGIFNFILAFLLMEHIRSIPLNRDTIVVSNRHGNGNPHGHRLSILKIGTNPKKKTSKTSTIRVEGHSSLRLFDHQDIVHPSFNPAALLETEAKMAAQPVNVTLHTKEPYFLFIPPGLMKKMYFSMNELRQQRHKHRVKRHHPHILQNVLGELQNYALVPIMSGNGEIRYILLKNPRFVIGDVRSGTGGAPVPTIVQIANQPAAQSRPQIVYNRPSPAPTPPTVPVTRPPLSPQPSGRPWMVSPVSGGSGVRVERLVQPSPIVPLASSPVNTLFSSQMTPTTLTGHSQRQSTNTASTHASNNMLHTTGGANNHAAMVESTSASTSNSMANTVDIHHSATNHVHGINNPGAGGAGQTVKTEVVETVVETQNQASAAAANAVQTASAAASQSGATGNTIIGGNVLTQTGAAASQSSSASTATAAKKEKKIVKKTTKTSVANTGTGAVQEITEVVESSVHSGSSAAVADVGATSVASSSGNTNVNGGSAAKIDSAAVAGSSAASSVSKSNTTSIKKKTIKKTIVTQTKPVHSHAPQGDSTLTGNNVAILSDTRKKKTSKKIPTAILSENNDKPKALNTKSALIATPKPKAAAKVIAKRRRKTTPAPVATTDGAGGLTTEEIEMEEYTTTAVPDIAYVRFGRERYAQSTASPHVVGWTGPTTEPTLGPTDRINTTDVPEEIEPLPDKTPAELRLERARANRKRGRSASATKRRQPAAKPKKTRNTRNRPRRKPADVHSVQQSKRYMRSGSYTTTAIPSTSKRPSRRPPPTRRRQPNRRPSRNRRPNQPRSRRPRKNNGSRSSRTREPNEDLPRRFPRFRDPFTRWLMKSVADGEFFENLPFWAFG